MTKKPSPQTPPTLSDNPFAPDFFADEATGFFVHNGVISITFSALKVDHSTSPGPVNRVVIARTVMPVVGAQALALGLYDFLKSTGLDPSKAVAGDSTVQ